ncbi:hypothetical protein HYY71_01245 [Candidatus Woesearchaeota archaeon]|nr:hypothetical protein [Candidatus Woesearchaeota archaeon]
MKKKIIVDLDVVTVGIWEKSDKRREQALKFMGRIENKEFEIVMLSSTLNLVEKWKNAELSTKIKEFYSKNTGHFTDDLEIFNFLRKHEVSASLVIDQFLKKGIKREDILLILACVATESDYLVTLNRRHLRDNEGTINSILNDNKLKKIKVVYPNEI